MTTVTINNDFIIVSILGIDQIWAFRKRFVIPLTHVVDVSAAQEEAKSWLIGWKIGGTHIPGVISAGTFFTNKRFVFWDVHNASNAIAITLRDERYQRLVVEVKDPTQVINTIKQAMF